MNFSTSPFSVYLKSEYEKRVIISWKFLLPIYDLLDRLVNFIQNTKKSRFVFRRISFKNMTVNCLNFKPVNWLRNGFYNGLAWTFEALTLNSAFFFLFIREIKIKFGLTSTSGYENWECGWKKISNSVKSFRNDNYHFFKERLYLYIYHWN